MLSAHLRHKGEDIKFGRDDLEIVVCSLGGRVRIVGSVAPGEAEQRLRRLADSEVVEFYCRDFDGHRHEGIAQVLDLRFEASPEGRKKFSLELQRI